ncbi:hypothetical protein [Aquimarina algiphila]|uniref:hypothetical protein n=1 Tax=Aquimarina algiphila TaxID=2047982 RepID=UPI00232ACDD0|nr:hypothetical protein [Aquimarina algiphila]
MKKKVFILLMVFTIGINGLCGQEQDILVISQHNFKVYRRVVDSVFYIISEHKKKKLYDSLVYVSIVCNDFVQILDNKGNVSFLDSELKEIDISNVVCSAIPCMPTSSNQYYIEEEEGEFRVFAKYIDDGNAKYKDDPQPVVVTVISKEKADDVYFLNSRRSLTVYDCPSGAYVSPVFIIEKNKKFTIQDLYNLTARPIRFYDTVFIDRSSKIRVKKDGFYGYHDVTVIKYSCLDIFEYNLAYFELQNGKRGYIDTSGNEYFIK